MGLDELVLKRAAVKRKITNVFKLVEPSANPSPAVFDTVRETVEGHLKEVLAFDENIGDIHLKTCEGEKLSKDYETELDKQSEYSMSIKLKLSELSKPVTTPPLNNAGQNCDLKLPPFECPKFSGESSNSSEYFDFRSQFFNLVGNRSNLTGSTKFSYLRSYLKGYAFKVVHHLSVTDTNFEVAVQVLDDEFLDKDSPSDF